MRYITQEQIKGFLNDRSLMALAGTLGAIDMALLEAINADASSEIDGYLRGVYALPLAEPVDGLLTTICGDLMKFRLLKRRDENNLPPPALELYKMAVSKLRDIQKRIVVLEVELGNEGIVESTADGTVRFSTPPQKFGNDFTGFNEL